MGHRQTSPHCLGRNTVCSQFQITVAPVKWVEIELSHGLLMKEPTCSHVGWALIHTCNEDIVIH